MAMGEGWGGGVLGSHGDGGGLGWGGEALVEASPPGSGRGLTIAPAGAGERHDG